MTTVALITKGHERLDVRIGDILYHDCWHDPIFVSQFMAKTYIEEPSQGEDGWKRLPRSVRFAEGCTRIGGSPASKRYDQIIVPGRSKNGRNSAMNACTHGLASCACSPFLV